LSDGLRKPLLLALGQVASSTGYSRILSNILSRVSRNFTAIHLGINYRGTALQRNGYTLLPNLLLGDQFGKKQLPELLREYQPDLVFLYHDIDFYSVHKPALDRFKEERPETAVVVYCPVEWEDTPPGIFNSLVGADHLVFFTEFRRNVFLRAIQTTGFDRLLRCPTEVIGHGVDTRRFFPLNPGSQTESRRKARDELIPGRPAARDGFLLLNANRNCPRKRIELTLRVFSEFSRGKPDAYLYLHMGMLDSGATC